MATIPDLWYVRLPNGRVVRTRSTKSLRQFVKSGRIPQRVHARRTNADPWQTLNQIKELADLAPKKRNATPQVKARAKVADQRATGSRRMLNELLKALDSSLQRTKLITSACTGLAIGVALILGEILMTALPSEWAWLGAVGTGLVTLFLFSVCTSVLTSLTARELSHSAPAELSETRGQIIGKALRLTGALALIGGSMAGLIFLLRSLPGWIATDEAGSALTTAVHVVNGLRLILEGLCAPILGLALLLLGPILVVEECSIFQAIRQWFGMLRQHPARIYVYQAAASAFALVLASPVLAPLVLSFGGTRPNTLGESVPFYLLIGAALTPLLSYLVVANVFVYLNLRYDFYYSTRDV